VVEQRADVFLEAGDNLGISEKRCQISRSGVVVVLTRPTIWGVGVVSDQGNNQAQATVVCSLEDIVKVPEGVRIELAYLGPMVCERMTVAPMALAVSRASSISNWLG
jgi:hypothetical protein